MAPAIVRFRQASNKASLAAWTHEMLDRRLETVRENLLRLATNQPFVRIMRAPVERG
jgi:hypothetical protein